MRGGARSNVAPGLLPESKRNQFGKRSIRTGRRASEQSAEAAEPASTDWSQAGHALSRQSWRPRLALDEYSRQPIGIMLLLAHRARSRLQRRSHRDPAARRPYRV